MKWSEVDWYCDGLHAVVRFDGPKHPHVVKEIEGIIRCGGRDIMPILHDKDGLVVHAPPHWALVVLSKDYPPESVPTPRPIAIRVEVNGKEYLFKPEDVTYVYVKE